MSDVPQGIFQHWLHSYEDDREDTKVYRPQHFDFPLSRERGGFEIKESGEFVQYDVGPADGSEVVVGHWKAKGTNTIEVYLEAQQIVSYRLKILSCDENVLKVKKYTRRRADLRFGN